MPGLTTLADVRVEWRPSYNTRDGVLSHVPAFRAEPTPQQRLGQAILLRLLADLGYRDPVRGDRPTAPCAFALAPRAEQRRRLRAAADVRAGRFELALDMLDMSGDSERTIVALLERLAFSTLQ